MYLEIVQPSVETAVNVNPLANTGTGCSLVEILAVNAPLVPLQVVPDLNLIW